MTKKIREREPRLCEYPNCGGVHKAKGYCSMHYQRWRRDPKVIENDLWFHKHQTDIED